MAAPQLTQVVPIDVGMARSATVRVGGDLAAVIGQVKKPDAPTRRLKWSLGETAAHVIQTVRLQRDCLRGAVSPRPFNLDTFGQFLADQNDERIEQEAERDPKRLADALRNALGEFDGEASTRSATEMVTYPGGYAIEFALTCAALLGEVLIHGYDIARSIRARWPISDDDARLVAYGIPAMLPLGVDPQNITRVEGRAHVRMRGGESFSLEVRSGRAIGGRCEGQADVTISAAPTPYLLASYGRISPIVPALTGQIVSWGRKPFFPLQLQRAFRSP